MATGAQLHGEDAESVGWGRLACKEGISIDEINAVAMAGDQPALCQDGLEALKRQNGYLVDSGTTISMTSDKSSIRDYRPARAKVTVASGAMLPIVGRGTARLMCPRADGGEEAVEFEVIHVPGIAHNLLSTDSLIDRGYRVLLDTQPCIVTPTGAQVLCERWRPRTLLFPVRATCITSAVLHARLGHASLKTCRRVAKEHGVSVTDDEGPL